MIFPKMNGLPLFITTVSFRFSGVQGTRGDLDSDASAFGSAGWPSNNLAIYTPIVLPFSYPIKRVFWVNGGTVTGNADFGIFDAITGKKLASTGSTAQSGANAPQYTSLDLLLDPGEYFFGLSLSLSTSTMYRTASVELPAMKLAGFLQEASAVPLPATMTPAAISNLYIPVCGVTQTSSGF